MQFIRSGLTLCALVLVGCSGGDPGYQVSASSGKSGDVAFPAYANSQAAEEAVSVAMVHSPESNTALVSQERLAPSQDETQSRRKIIYNATVNMIVDSFDGVAAGILDLCDQHAGFVARANVSGRSGDHRCGTWVLRIPSSQYRSFLSTMSDVGEVQSTSEESQEVTAEYYDVEARIRNKEREEARLVEVLENQTGKLPEILSVEKEIARVRGEVEQLQGRIRVLRDQTAFSTITVSVTEVQGYVPAAAPTFATRIARQWEATVTEMLSFGAACVLCVVAVGPWLILLGLLLAPCVVIGRRMRKRRLRQIPA